ncbi:hypothetical protein [Deinococcus pimensis]|uniref:hypothetical protein n=1 Tax=Deinococcus pimensis TaxID=309888 RepID=UPI000481E5AD|nr:hypothetical protein [Deinococcus pimensis]
MNRPFLGLAALVLSALLGACGTTELETGGNVGPGPSGPTGDALPAQLQGDWESGYVSPIEYYDPSSGRYAEASGTSMMLKLTADGRFERVGITVVSTYSCTTKVLLRQSGVVRLSGDVLTLVPTTSYSKGYTCSPANAYESRELKDSVNTWKVTGTGAQAVLALGDPEGQARDSLYNRPRGTGGGGGTGGAVSGTISMPAGANANLTNLVVMACAVDGGCSNQEKWRFTKLSVNAKTTSYTVEGLLAEPYTVVAFTDWNRNAEIDYGEYFGGYTTDGNNFAPITAPASGLDFVMQQR